MTNDPGSSPPFPSQGAEPALSEFRDALRLQALGLMTADIAHDLGDMMQVLTKAVTMIEHHPRLGEIEGLRPVVAGAASALQRTDALISQIVGFAREERASDELVDVPLCIAGLERLLRWICPHAVHLRLSVAVDLPLLVCNRRNFENAVLNLVLNAGDATPPGGLITVRGQTAQDIIIGDCILFSVSDTGAGMSRETLERAFAPFFSTKPGTDRGLGLAMVRRFAQDTGGYAEIESIIGVGTTVVMRLPTSRLRSP